MHLSFSLHFFIHPSDEQKLSIVEATKSDELKKRNNLIKDLDVDGVSNKSPATVTTTSITVNIKQTSVNANESIGEVVSTVAEAATAAVTSAAGKIEADKKPKSSSPVDVEMEDLTADIEMGDASSKAPITSTVEVIEEAPVTTTNSQNEQKIDDVEKNISNLFNGEENAVSDEAESASKNGIGTSGKDAATNADCSTSSVKVASENGEKSAKEPNEKVTPSDDVIKDAVSDSSDLVSILTDDNPQTAAKISSTSSSKADAKESVVGHAKATATANNSVENKLLTSIAKSVTSTPSSSTGQNVYNSTPIQKQFEISSENVSTISEAATDTEPGLGDKSMRQEIISSHSSTLNKSSDISSGAVTGKYSRPVYPPSQYIVIFKHICNLCRFAGSDSDQTSSDNLTRFAKNIRKFNGIGADETDDASQASEPTSAAVKRDAKKAESTVTPTETGVSSSSEDNVYEINICYDDAELVFFGVEKQDKSNNSSAVTDHTSEKVSSVGSVSSMTEPFSLPTRCATITSTNSTLSSTSSSSALASSTVKRTKHVVKGTLALCKFMIDHFQNVRTSLTGSAAGSSSTSHLDATPLNTGSGRGRGKASAALSTPTSTTASNKRKRSAAPSATATPNAADATDADEAKVSSKKAKKETPAADSRKSIASPSVASNYPEKAVLARWVDKKFYAGRVIEQKANNKYVVLFEDGAKKVLPEEHIVFGEENILPLENESVHALVKDDTYEPGIVQSVKNKGDAIYYTVLCESTTVTVTASDIYLEDDQAKVILSKKAPSSANQPEPGFSGGINTRKDRRQKRYS